LALIPSFSTLKAEPWPRFHTDIMSVFVVLATQCTGPLKFIEYMYDDRFGFVQALRDMGAQIRTDGPHVIVVEGGRKLAGNEMLLRPDIRSGAAMLIAALAADGSSVLHDRRGVIARGYEDLPGMLNALGANIEEIGPLFS
jgi:UDP-N-acetylglucosamine 1-carboxyvinyltransferase